MYASENLDKPLLTINSVHGIQHYGRRTIYLPTQLSQLRKFGAKIKHEYLCKYGPDCGESFDDLYVHHMPNSQEILMASKKLESMLSHQIPNLTPLQKQIRDNGTCPLISYDSTEFPIIT